MAGMEASACRANWSASRTLSPVAPRMGVVPGPAWAAAMRAIEIPITLAVWTADVGVGQSHRDHRLEEPHRFDVHLAEGRLVLVEVEEAERPPESLDELEREPGDLGDFGLGELPCRSARAAGRPSGDPPRRRRPHGRSPRRCTRDPKGANAHGRAPRRAPRRQQSVTASVASSSGTASPYWGALAPGPVRRLTRGAAETTPTLARWPTPRFTWEPLSVSDPRAVLVPVKSFSEAKHRFARGAERHRAGARSPVPRPTACSPRPGPSRWPSSATTPRSPAGRARGAPSSCGSPDAA